MPRITLTPPLLNSATPWATTKEDLAALYDSPYTGAVTTRTTLLAPFPDDPTVHQHTLFSTSSLNTYGYSPHPLSYYLTSLLSIITLPQTKPIIVSITGTPASIATSISTIASFASSHSLTLYAEINLSCPNIPGHPPPAYDAAALRTYLSQLPSPPPFPIGLKTPPYTHQAQFTDFIAAVKDYPDALAFVTATNTLGSSLHLTRRPGGGYERTLASAGGTGVGGLAGEAIHWVSLGNVDVLRRGLDAVGLGEVVVIGVGGVGDLEGMERMMAVGAGAVAVGTALGREGVKVFERISKGVRGRL